jgi:hypothetical protein
MPKSRNRKKHNSKLNDRRKRINESLQKRNNFIKNLIKLEQEKGLFENNKDLNLLDNKLTIDGPEL